MGVAGVAAFAVTCLLIIGVGWLLFSEDGHNAGGGLIWMLIFVGLIGWGLTVGIYDLGVAIQGHLS